MKALEQSLRATSLHVQTVDVVCRCGARTVSIDPREFGHLKRDVIEHVAGVLAIDTAARCGTADEAPACTRRRKPARHLKLVS